MQTLGKKTFYGDTNTFYYDTMGVSQAWEKLGCKDHLVFSLIRCILLPVAESTFISFMKFIKGCSDSAAHAQSCSQEARLRQLAPFANL